MQKLKMTDADYSQLAKVLRKVDFFAPMTVGQLDMILPYILLYEFSAGETVCKQGEEGDAFYVIRDGRMGVKVKNGFLSLGKEVAELGPGDFFGEMALLTREPRAATVKAKELSRVFALTSANFEYVLQQNPGFAAEIKMIADRRKFQTKHES